MIIYYFQSESPSPPLPVAKAQLKQEANLKRERVSPMHHHHQRHDQQHVSEAEPAVDDRHRLQSESEQQAANFVSRLLDDDDDDVVVDDGFLKEEIKDEPRVVRQVRILK